ncbi:TDP-N-acetylfucosamine:lipid II N-acetylfucosaminyltransferase [Sphingobacterium thalpophilum]|uniref:TDP-N-acetylfucosamine:lipid II N-acetylfucosaminyltransferase n=1 Tax=Sphingobacterium thalpophilum TaxID=259 RepID=UPI003C77FC60
MNLHIFHDDKFTNGAIEQFERAYPEQNRYIILLYDQKELKYTTLSGHTAVFHIRDLDLVKNLRTIIATFNISRLFIHFMDDFKAALSNRLLERFRDIKLYWIFYGGDLYDYLSRYKGYHILDNPELVPKQSWVERWSKLAKYLILFRMSQKSAKDKIFRRLDYFCFWNEYDYDLFKAKIETSAHYKDFIYYNALGNPDHIQQNKKDIIMVNHAASFTGNHLYIIDKLAKSAIPLRHHQLLLPLSYGNKPYANQVIAAAERLLNMDIKPLTNFLPLEEYQAILADVKIAIFGMRRQEAAGNIFQLLNLGAKVFLRKDNTLLSWLRKRNFIVFCLEEDREDLENLRPLTVAQMSHNNAQYKKYFNESVYDYMMDRLIVDDQNMA